MKGSQCIWLYAMRIPTTNLVFFVRQRPHRFVVKKQAMREKVIKLKAMDKNKQHIGLKMSSVETRTAHSQERFFPPLRSCYGIFGGPLIKHLCYLFPVAFKQLSVKSNL